MSKVQNRKISSFAMEFVNSSRSEDGKRGLFSGYASTWNIDSHKTRMLKGCFVATIQEFRDAGKRIPILYQHDHTKVIGYIDPEMIREDEKGLYIEEAVLLIDDIDLAREVFVLIENKTLGGMSIGFSPRKIKKGSNGSKEDYPEVRLWEVSCVTWASNVQSEFIGTREEEDEHMQQRSQFSKGMIFKQACGAGDMISQILWQMCYAFLCSDNKEWQDLEIERYGKSVEDVQRFFAQFAVDLKSESERMSKEERSGLLEELRVAFGKASESEAVEGRSEEAPSEQRIGAALSAKNISSITTARDAAASAYKVLDDLLGSASSSDENDADEEGARSTENPSDATRIDEGADDSAGEDSLNLATGLSEALATLSAK